MRIWFGRQMIRGFQAGPNHRLLNWLGGSGYSIMMKEGGQKHQGLAEPPHLGGKEKSDNNYLSLTNKETKIVGKVTAGKPFIFNSNTLILIAKIGAYSN